MDGLEFLKAQHRAMEELFQRISQAANVGERLAQFEELTELLRAHDAIEREHFYPALVGEQAESLVEEALADHDWMDGLLTEVGELPPDEELRFAAKLSTLRGQVDQHAREVEEGEIMPLAEKLLDAQQRQRMGRAMAMAMRARSAERERRRAEAERGAQL